MSKDNTSHNTTSNCCKATKRWLATWMGVVKQMCVAKEVSRDHTKLGKAKCESCPEKESHIALSRQL